MNTQEGCTLPTSPSWRAALSEHQRVLEASDMLLPSLEAVAAALSSCLKKGGKVLVCGNGGSHAHAQHFAAELVVRYKRTRDPMAAIALGSNPAVLTAVMNDMNPRDIFVREAKALLVPDDVLIGISTSGVSSNVCRALGLARDLKAVTVGLTGQGGMGVKVDHEIRVPSASTARIQEMHMLVIHWLCETLNA
jgi:D-sedoheptulose 7-phosphate isomerase